VLGKIAADAIMVAAMTLPRAEPTAVGFGGTHYAAKHTRICLDGDYQIGHVVPKHAVEKGVPDKVIQDTIRKTTGSCKTALVDWKGLSGLERRRLVDLLDNLGCEVVRS
jgi:D-aminoacyl-tRNA deacylase